VLEQAAPLETDDAKAKKENPRPHQILWSDALAKQLKKAEVKIVILSACETAMRDAHSFSWSGVAPALLKAGIPVVIGMQYVISDGAAITFARGFYTSIAAGLTVDEAVAFGRQSVMLMNPDDFEDEGEDDGPRYQDWGVPVLYSRAPDDALFPDLASTFQALASAGVSSPSGNGGGLLEQRDVDAPAVMADSEYAAEAARLEQLRESCRERLFGGAT